MDLPLYEPEILDSTAIMCYKTCARKYQYRMVFGYDVKTTMPYFAFGTAYHKFREQLELEPKDQDEKITFENSSARALQHWSKAGVEAPIGTKWDFLNTTRLIKSLVEAYSHWKKEKNAKKIIVLASEQSFSLRLPDGTVTGGRADQIVRWNGKVWGRDFKTSSKLGPYYERTLEPNDQFTRYTWAESQLAGEKVQGQIVEVLYNSKKDGPKIIPYMTSRTEWQIETWIKEHRFWTNQIRLSREQNMYPMNEKSCAFCEYHSVCKMPSEASMIQHLKSNYQLKPWRFEEIHGEA